MGKKKQPSQEISVMPCSECGKKSKQYTSLEGLESHVQRVHSNMDGVVCQKKTCFLVFTKGRYHDHRDVRNVNQAAANEDSDGSSDEEANGGDEAANGGANQAANEGADAGGEWI